ncbi:MAG TPA: DUF4136 domain-containing protein [Alphaproteobacteria bacterium]|nr:DUF4136 domain-containing protein [Alphaproteobacteria bacterium]
MKPRKIFRPFALAVMLSALAGCATNFTADVTRFQQLPKPSGETIEVVPKNPSDANALSFKKYAQMIGTHLGAVGYKPPQSGTPSTYIATIDYGVSAGPAPATMKKRSPVQIGIGVGTGSRHTGFGMGVSTGVGTPRSDKPVNNRWLQMVITRRSDGQQLYEGKVTSLGEGDSINPVMPLLIDALFKDFPGKSGTTSHVELGPEPKP